MFNFKKIASVLASAVMLSSTIGFAAAATFPAPFDSGSAIVYGANGNVQVDMAAAVNIQTAIGTMMGGEVGIPEGSWKVATSSDDLEIAESIAEVNTYIDKDDLSIFFRFILSTNDTRPFGVSKKDSPKKSDCLRKLICNSKSHFNINIFFVSTNSSDAN